MVVKLRSVGGPDPSLDRMIGKLGSLVSDMEALRTGATPQSLAGPSSPVLDGWRFRLGNNLYMEGMSTGHPKLVGTGRLISTSEVFLVTEDQKFARTLSRWYRLGEPGASEMPR